MGAASLFSLRTQSKKYVSLCRRFNWRHSAAQYIYRDKTMEDYLAEYTHSLAAYK